MIDLGYSEDKSESSANVSPGHRTGTKPFISGELLANANMAHQLHHDFDSFYYVFLYACVTFTGPHEERKELPYFMHEWMFNTNPRVIADMKGFHLLMSEEAYVQLMKESFTPYMSDLVTCALRLRNIVKLGGGFADGQYSCRATHDNLIDVLTQAAIQLGSTDAEALKGVQPANEGSQTQNAEAFDMEIPDMANETGSGGNSASITAGDTKATFSRKRTLSEGDDLATAQWKKSRHEIIEKTFDERVVDICTKAAEDDLRVTIRRCSGTI